jgi:hypothetical protein
MTLFTALAVVSLFVFLMLSIASLLIYVIFKFIKIVFEKIREKFFKKRCRCKSEAN